MKLVLKMEDATRYLPHNPVGVEYRWYITDHDKIDSLTKKPTLVMVGTKAACEAYLRRVQKQ